MARINMECRALVLSVPIREIRGQKSPLGFGCGSAALGPFVVMNSPD
jgi:hypothetical protein